MSGERTPGWWNNYFLRLAELVASASKDPSTKCGAVIVRPDKTVAATGFNGFPKGCDDDPEIYANRNLKYARVVHAEVNAVLHCRDPFPLDGYTMYTWPANIGPTCDRCASTVIQSGVSKIVHRPPAAADIPGFVDRWGEACQRGLDMYAEAGVEILKFEPELRGVLMA